MQLSFVIKSLSHRDGRGHSEVSHSSLLSRLPQQNSTFINFHRTAIEWETEVSRCLLGKEAWSRHTIGPSSRPVSIILESTLYHLDKLEACAVFFYYYYNFYFTFYFFRNMHFHYPLDDLGILVLKDWMYSNALLVWWLLRPFSELMSLYWLIW